MIRIHWPGTLVLALALALAGACSPTEGEDGVFDPVETTNDDFQAALVHDLGNLPLTMDLTVDGTGRLDLVAVVNNLADEPLNPDGTFNDTGTVSLLRSNGDGSFTDLQRLNTEAFPTLALWADLDGANERDLVLLDEQNRRVAVYRSSGPGSWPAVPSQSFSFDRAVVQLVVADVNGDLANDIVLRPSDENFITTLLNSGGGVLTRHDSEAFTLLGRFAVGQFNAGSNLDLAVLRPSSNRIELFQWSPASNTFRQSLPTDFLDVTPGMSRIVAAPLDGDGDVDLATLSIPSGDDASLVSVYRNDGNGNFTLDDVVSVPTRGRDLFVLNTVTAQAGLDLAVTHRSLRGISFLAADNANYEVVPLDTTRNAIDVITAQVTGNANRDLVTAEADRRAVGIFRGNGSGGFTRTQIGFLSKVTFPRAVDLAGTGLANDLLLLQPNSDRLVILRNNN